MPRRHLANENDHENLSAIIKPYKKNKRTRFYLLKFLTPVLVVINYLKGCQSLLLFVKLTVIFLLFRALINTTKDDGRSLFITMPFSHQMAPLYFA